MSSKTNRKDKAVDQLSEKEIEQKTAEFKELRAKAIKELQEEIDYLSVEAEYQRLLADIEEHKARRILNIARQQQFLQKEGDSSSESEDTN